MVRNNMPAVLTSDNINKMGGRTAGVIRAEPLTGHSLAHNSIAAGPPPPGSWLFQPSENQSIIQAINPSPNSVSQPAGVFIDSISSRHLDIKTARYVKMSDPFPDTRGYHFRRDDVRPFLRLLDVIYPSHAPTVLQASVGAPRTLPHPLGLLPPPIKPSAVLARPRPSPFFPQRAQWSGEPVGFSRLPCPTSPVSV